jgi:23S rRNA pseudouridine2605 synthase
MSRVRIQKALAEAGVASRRAAETMVLEGRVEVNGEVVIQIPCFVDVQRDRICVDGRAVALASAAKTCYLLNKPRGVVCALGDARARPRVYDLVPYMTGQVYCVGGLDVDSTGLVLLTNDGALADQLNHPRHGVLRTYVVEVDGSVAPQAVDKIAAGVFIDGRRAAPRSVKVLRRGRDRTLLEIELVESAGREVRPILIRLGYKSRRLKRTAIGAASIQGVPIGQFRRLGAREMAALKSVGDRARRVRRPRGRR